MSVENRIRWLHKRIADRRYPNASRLAERFGISHRQAQRDVDFLKNSMGAPLSYDAARRGFYYTEEFSLPSYTVLASDQDYVDTVTGAPGRLAEEEFVQMEIPYTAVLHIPDKLTRIELQRFIVGEEARGDYICEFQNVEMFLGVLFNTERPLTVKKPGWLRERLVAAARRVLEHHKES